MSGQYSHNIHRLTEDDKIIDIPLSSQHGINYPVAMCVRYILRFLTEIIANEYELLYLIIIYAVMIDVHSVTLGETTTV
jgi:hypothetical protein